MGGSNSKAKPWLLVRRAAGSPEASCRQDSKKDCAWQCDVKGKSVPGNQHEPAEFLENVRYVSGQVQDRLGHRRGRPAAEAHTVGGPSHASCLTFQILVVFAEDIARTGNDARVCSPQLETVLCWSI